MTSPARPWNSRMATSWTPRHANASGGGPACSAMEPTRCCSAAARLTVDQGRQRRPGGHRPAPVRVAVGVGGLLGQRQPRAPRRADPARSRSSWPYRRAVTTTSEVSERPGEGQGSRRGRRVAPPAGTAGAWPGGVQQRHGEVQRRRVAATARPRQRTRATRRRRSDGSAVNSRPHASSPSRAMRSRSRSSSWAASSSSPAQASSPSRAAVSRATRSRRRPSRWRRHDHRGRPGTGWPRPARWAAGAGGRGRWRPPGAPRRRRSAEAVLGTPEHHQEPGALAGVLGQRQRRVQLVDREVPGALVERARRGPPAPTRPPGLGPTARRGRSARRSPPPGPARRRARSAGRRPAGAASPAGSPRCPPRRPPG